MAAMPAFAATAPQNGTYLEEFDFTPAYDLSGLVNFNLYADTGNEGIGFANNNSRDFTNNELAIFTEGGIPQVAETLLLATSSLDTSSPNHLVLALNDTAALAAEGSSFASVFGTQYDDGTSFTEDQIAGAVESLRNPGSDNDAINAAVSTIFNFSNLVVEKGYSFSPDDPFQLIAFSDGQNIGSGTSSQIFTPNAPSAVPEPSTWAMMIGGIGLIGGGMRRAQQTSRNYFKRKGQPLLRLMLA